MRIDQINAMTNFNSVMETLYYDEVLKNMNERTCSTTAMIPHITFQVTENCNLKCSYCYQVNKTSSVLDLTTAYQFIDMLLLNNKGIEKYLDTKHTIGCSLDFIGGEPFLQVNLIDKILDYFVKKIIELDHPWQYIWRASITTNGTIFNETIKTFLKKWDGRIDVTVTIDGNKENHDKCRKFPDGTGSYDKAIQFLDWQKNNSSIGILGSKMTISPDNLQYFYDGIVNFINLGYTIIHCNCVFEKGWTIEHAKIYYNELKKIADYLLNNQLTHKIVISRFSIYSYRPLSIEYDISNHCGGNGRMLALTPNGDIYPCIRYAPSSLKEKSQNMKLGNVKDGILIEEKIQKQIEQLKTVNRINASPQKCLDCPIASGCAWCTAYNYDEGNGNLNYRATNICYMHKAEALANTYFWNKHYRNENELKRFKLWLSDEEALKIINQEELNMLHNLEE